mmetsp:Transcript_7972/g.18480  ORF Transcript_7972/g.18480 Transcript_7972/m.18480 type:complete len:229 (+) Transcript_7972:973-1659(+)
MTSRRIERLARWEATWRRTLSISWFLPLMPRQATDTNASSASRRHAAASSAAKFNSKATASTSCSLLLRLTRCMANEAIVGCRLVKEDLAAGSTVMWYSSFRATFRMLGFWTAAMSLATTLLWLARAARPLGSKERLKHTRMAKNATSGAGWPSSSARRCVTSTLSSMSLFCSKTESLCSMLSVLNNRSSCLPNIGTSIWHNFCLTNFSSWAVSSDSARSTKTQICNK